MRRHLAVAALAAAILSPLPALAAGAFKTFQSNDAIGNHLTQFYDMSGTGVGPFIPAYVCTDGAGNLCATGGTGGGSAADQSGTNATDGQATSTNNQHALAFNYGWNGSAWDRVYVDATTHGLLVKNALIEAGVGAIGDAAYVGTGNASMIAALKGVYAKLAAPLTVSTPDVRLFGQSLSSAVNSTLVIPVNGAGTLGLSFSGLTASGATITFSASNDGGTTYTAVGSFNAATGVASGTYTADGQTRIDIGGRTNVKMTVTTGGTGTITVSATVSQVPSLVANTSPLVAQAALGKDIGAVEQFGTWTVGVSPGQTIAATQSGAYTVTQGPAGSTAWKVDGSGVTQPVSMASAPLPAGAATSANQTNVQSAPGTSAGTALTIQGVSNGVAIPTTPTNAATVATAANQNSTAAGTSASNAQAVQGVTGGVALPVSGTVTANLGTIAGAATAANQLRFATFLEATNASVAASATFTGGIRTVNPSNFTRFNASVLVTGGAATLNVIGCNDSACGSAFTDTSTPLTANTQQRVTVPAVYPYYRISVVNGSSTNFVYATTSMTAN